jgi:hypothetical protein
VAWRGARWLSGGGRRQSLMDEAPSSAAQNLRDALAAPGWARAGLAGAAGGGAAGGGAAGGGAAGEGGGGARAAEARARAAEGEEEEDDGRWAVEEVFAEGRRRRTKLDRLVQPSTRARMLFMTGVFFPPLLLLNVALHWRSEEPYLRRWAVYSAGALAGWGALVAMWVVVAQGDGEGAEPEAPEPPPQQPALAP